MYTLNDYGQMMRDPVRVNAHLEALRQAVRPGDVVIDLGAGVGVFALFACKLGAKHVYAIDYNDYIALGPSLAAANGFSDKVTFIKALSTKIELPEPADVLFGDLRGRLPFYNHNFSSFADAYNRLLKPGGIIIPQKDHLYAGFLEAPKHYQRHIRTPWEENLYDLDLRAGLAYQANTLTTKEAAVTPNAVALPGQLWYTVHYGKQQDQSITNTLHWTVERAVTTHYVIVWFDTDLYNGIGFSHAPGTQGANVYGDQLLPLREPLALNAGDEVDLNLSAYLINGEYVWSWSVKHTLRDGSAKKWDHSTLFSKPLSQELVYTNQHESGLNRTGRITVMVLDRLRQRQEHSEIAAELRAAFPKAFAEEAAASAYVAQLATVYSSDEEE